MSASCNKDYEICFTDMPLQSVMAEWLIKNTRVPTNIATILAHLSLFILTWYVVKFAIRLFISIIWPFLIVCFTLIIIRVYQNMEPDDFIPMVLEKSAHVIRWTVKIVGKMSHIIPKKCSADSKNCTW